MANVLQTVPQDWKYVSEGGATIVFSYIGHSHPTFDGMVLRLRKTSLADTSTNEGREKDLGGTNLEDELDDPSIEYQTKCIQRLIPAEHLPQLQTVQIHRSWLEELSAFHNPSRPEGRRMVDKVDLTRKKAVLATDLVSGHWLAVEIKVSIQACHEISNLSPKLHFSLAAKMGLLAIGHLFVRRNEASENTDMSVLYAFPPQSPARRPRYHRILSPRSFFR